MSLNPAADLPDRFNAAAHFIEPHLQARPDKVAIECGEQRVTYAELSRAVNRTGNALRELGVRMEERVAMLVADCPEFAFSFFGAIKIGAVPVPLNTLLKSAEYEYLLNDTRARVAIVSETLLPHLDAIPRNRLLFLEHIVVIGAAAKNALSFRELMVSQSSELTPAPTHKNDAAFWLYSSGSTGPSKGCIHLQHDMVVTSELYAKNILGISERDRFFSVAKLFFAYGLGNGLYFPFSVGATSILLTQWPQPAAVFDTIERHRPTLLFSVPTNFAGLLAHKQEGRDFDLSSVRYAVSAGEALPASIFERFKARFRVEILDAIGSTEALHMFIANRPGDVRPGSSGRILPGMDARILDENGCPVPIGEIGNLFICSDAVCAGYWNQHERTKATFEGRWLRTGDKYRQDEDGYFWYAGRSDDMLKVNGVWVSPVEIESVLTDHPAVREVAVVGRKDDDELVKPAAFIVLDANNPPSIDLAHELQEFVVSRLSHHKRPRWVEFVADLPKTATGKIQRYRLRQRETSAEAASC